MKAARYLVTSYCDARETFYYDIVVMPSAEGAIDEVSRRRPYVDAIDRNVQTFETLQEQLETFSFSSDSDLKHKFMKATARDKNDE